MSPQSGDIITLENYEEKLPSWSPDATNQLYAIVDMGSNGIRFTISDLSPPRTRLLKCIYRERAGISLFEALTSASSSSSAAPTAPGADLSFPPETITLVSQTFARFRRIADAHGVPLSQTSVLATEAMRRASNSEAMLGAIRAESGWAVDILSPPVETLFGAVMGARSAFSAVERGGLFLDLGGGSVQMTWVDSGVEGYEVAAAKAGKCMPFGAARLISVLEGGKASARNGAKEELRRSMKDAFSSLCAEFSSLREAAESSVASDKPWVDVYLCGGGFRGYGSMLMHTDPIQPYPIPWVGTYTVSGEAFRQTKRMREVNQEFEGKILGMSKRRRRQFPAVLEVLEAFIDAVPPIRTATFCAGANRDGALLMKLPRSLRESNPLEALAGITPEDAPAVGAVLDALRSALPEIPELADLPTVLSLGLGPLFARGIWGGLGEYGDSNSSLALHDAATRDPGAPGLTHLARAVLGITGCARWAGTLGPIDAQLYEGLRSVLDAAHEEANFWAAYIGAVAHVLMTFVPARPGSAEDITAVIKIKAILDRGEKKVKVKLTIEVAEAAARGVDFEDLTETFKQIGKRKGEKRDIKVKAEIRIVPQL